MIVLVLAVTLILGLALPRKQEPEVQKPVSFQVDSQWDAIVKRVEVSKGSQVEPGTVVVVLTDPKLEAEISRLETKLREAELGTMEAVAEPGMLGVIGSVPRVIWESPEEESVPIPFAPEKTVSTPTKKLVKADLSKHQQAQQAAESDVQEVEGQIELAATQLSQLESDLATAQANFDRAAKEHEKLQRLYDLGAIPKKQLDASTSESDSAGVALAELKQRRAEAVARQEQLEKRAVESRASLALAREDLAEAAKTREEVSEEVAPEPPAQVAQSRYEGRGRRTKPVKKIVYGSAPTSFAPVKVNLIEDETPNETKRIEDIRTKLLGLKAKRELLKLRALRAGRVRWIAEPGDKVAVGDPLIEIEY